MNALFELEPAGLLAHFLAHPPEGFRAWRTAAGVPLFTAPFDLLTTLDPALLRRLRALRIDGVLRRLLTWQVCFAGSTVSEYLPLPRAVAPGALIDGLLQEWGGRTALLILKDLPQDGDLVGAEDRVVAGGVLEACAQRGFLQVEGQALGWLPLAGLRDARDWLQSLSAGRRRDFGRKLRSRRDLEVTILRTGCAELQDETLLGRLYGLYEQVYAQSELHFDRHSAAFFRAVLQDAALCGVLFLYRDRTGTLIGFNLCFEHAGRLVDKYVGFAYPAAREHNLYFVSWAQNLDYAIARGLQAYIAGWTDPEIKARLGARFAFTRHAVYVRNPLLRAVLARMTTLFEGDRARLGGGRG